AGDDHVVYVALAEAGTGDANEAGALLQLFDGGAAEIAHAGAEGADPLIDHRLQRSAGGNAAFDAFGHVFGEAVTALFACRDRRTLVAREFIDVGLALEVALAGALRHRAERAHAAIGLEAAALVEDGLAGALVHAGEERA